MAIFEFRCEEHGVFERIQLEPQNYTRCPICEELVPRVEWSVPAKRNPMYGEQK